MLKSGAIARVSRRIRRREHSTGQKTVTAPQPASATSRFAEANGVKLHYLDYGTAGKQPILCLHGGAAHAHWFDFIASGFTADYHVLALDLRGHGDSDWAERHTYAFQTYAADVAAFVEKLDLRDFVLIGHSMGGMVALLYSATHPGRVSRLVVVDSTMLMPADRVAKMREFGTKPPRTHATRDELVERYRLEPAGPQLAAPEVIRHVALHAGRQNADGTWQHKADRRVYANFERIEGLPLWEKVKIPALVVKGEHSTRFLPPTLAEIRSRAPQVQWAEVPASDHHITLDNPEGFVEAVSRFLRG
jgi:pimeloyl-ACP methyl ester carboxylesterase